MIQATFGKENALNLIWKEHFSTKCKDGPIWESVPPFLQSKSLELHYASTVGMQIISVLWQVKAWYECKAQGSTVNP